MMVQKDNIGDVNIARLSGDLDSTTSAEVHAELMPILLDRRPVLLDFTDVTHVSDGGLRTMLVIYRQAQAVDGTVAVVGLSGELYGALAATGFLKFFRVADDITSGLQALHDVESRSVVS